MQGVRYRLRMQRALGELKTNDVLQLSTNQSAHERSEPEVKEAY